jgi:YD repeat-containing protein
MNASQNVVRTVLLDGLGRTSQTQITSDPQGTDYTVTTYDALGRVGTIYNPTRCSPPTTNCGESNWGLTSYVYDALSRPTSVSLPDGNSTSASYANNTVTVTDPTSKARKLQSDSLGRLTSVWEDPGGLNYLTTYSYDALGNLTGVVRNGSSNRSYTYDFLSRLTAETTPEAGTVSYAFNGNGDLYNRTDARGVVTTYGEDMLHRLTGKSYSDSTPTVTYVYDLSNPFGETATNTIGRLVAVWAGSNPQFDAWSAFSYDAMGRTTTQWNRLSFPLANPCATVYTGHGRTCRDRVRRSEFSRWRDTDAETHIPKRCGRRRDSAGMQTLSTCRGARTEKSGPLSRSGG